MRLTTFTDYSFRVLISLALRDEGGSTVQAIAEEFGISRNHLMKVVQKLGQAGFVETTRGRGGGLRLGRPADQIRLGDVVRGTEEGMDIVPCFREEDRSCSITKACRLRGILARANDAWMQVLDEHTLADLVSNDRALLRILRTA